MVKTKVNMTSKHYGLNNEFRSLDCGYDFKMEPKIQELSHHWYRSKK